MSGEVVQSVYGKVRGSGDADCLIFKGIPYGASTAGANRFRAPQHPAPWTGVREATRFGPAAPQLGLPGTPDGLWAGMSKAMYPDTGGPVGIGVPVSEDCLILNVWTPSADTSARPVMVWLHGGAFLSGAGSELWFHADNLASRGDVVVVTVNHRLGLLGYLDVASVVGDSFQGAGIAGMLDLVAALQWVRDNIAGFGGDPGNVTIFGQSGGGAKVSTLLAMPEATGLFHRAIIQSAPALRAVEPTDGAQLAKDVFAELGLRPDQITDLQELPVDALLAAQGAVMMRSGGPLAAAMRIGPVLDGTRLPHHPFEPAAPAPAAQVPLLIGTNVDETAMFLCMDPEFGQLTVDGVRTRLQPQFGDRVDDVLATYRHNHPEATPTRLWTRITSDGWMRAAATTIAERKVAGGSAPVFLYLFTYETPILDGVLGSCHSLELPFVFDTVDRVPFAGDRPDRFVLAAAMRDAWTSFARNGDPSHPAIPGWPRYDAEARATMLIDTQWCVAHDPFGDELRLASAGQPLVG